MGRENTQIIPDSQEMPAPIRYTKEEGGVWWDWAWDVGPRPAFFAVMFSNGAVFDITNGWRKHKFCPHCGHRKIDVS